MTNKELLKIIYQQTYSSTGGKRCKDFHFGCWSCQRWMAYDIFCDSIKMSELQQPAKAERCKMKYKLEITPLVFIQVPAIIWLALIDWRLAIIAAVLSIRIN